jgi:hypothetical protein
MTRIQIIGAPFSSYVWVVRMACEEKRVPYDLVPAGIHSPEPRSRVGTFRIGCCLGIFAGIESAVVDRADAPIHRGNACRYRTRRRPDG